MQCEASVSYRRSLGTLHVELDGESGPEPGELHHVLRLDDKIRVQGCRGFGSILVKAPRNAHFQVPDRTAWGLSLQDAVIGDVLAGAFGRPYLAASDGPLVRACVFTVSRLRGPGANFDDLAQFVVSLSLPPSASFQIVFSADLLH